MIDEPYAAHPEFGYRRTRVWLNKEKKPGINRKAVCRHMRETGIQTVYPRRNTGKASPENPVYPYLLNGLRITRPNQVWSIDITHVPVRADRLYLVAVLDRRSRCVPDRRASDSLETGFAPDACRGALRKAVPEIVNSDRGSRFTSPKHTGPFLEAGAQISMGRRGRAYDNIFAERLGGRSSARMFI